MNGYRSFSREAGNLYFDVIIFHFKYLQLIPNLQMLHTESFCGLNINGSRGCQFATSEGKQKFRWDRDHLGTLCEYSTTEKRKERMKFGVKLSWELIAVSLD